MPHSMRDVCFVMFDNETQRKKKSTLRISLIKQSETQVNKHVSWLGLGEKNTLYNQVARQLMRIYLPFFFFFLLKIVCSSLLFRLFRLFRHDRKKKFISSCRKLTSFDCLGGKNRARGKRLKPQRINIQCG